MKFSQLDEKSKNFLIDQLDIQIEEKATEEGVNDYDNPTPEEYEDFFNNFDRDYEIKNGFPEPTIPDEFCAKYNIEFEGKKVILNTFDPEYE